MQNFLFKSCKIWNTFPNNVFEKNNIILYPVKKQTQISQLLYHLSKFVWKIFNEQTVIGLEETWRKINLNFKA